MIASDLQQELNKELIYSDKPSLYFESLKLRPGFSEDLPELSALIGVKQNPRFHAEGDVWNHSMMVIDSAVSFRDKVSNPLGFMLSALCHDFGKALCTEEINGVIHSYKHEIIGLPAVSDFLNRLSYEKSLIDYVLNMVRLHMRPNMLVANNSSRKACNKLFSEACAPEDLIYLAISDGLGQLPQIDAEKNLNFLFEKLGIYKSLMARPFFTENDLIEAGITAPDILSEAMAFANKLKLADISSEAAFKQTLSQARKLQNKLEKSLN